MPTKLRELRRRTMTFSILCLVEELREMLNYEPSVHPLHECKLSQLVMETDISNRTKTLRIDGGVQRKRSLPPVLRIARPMGKCIHLFGDPATVLNEGNKLLERDLADARSAGVDDGVGNRRSHRGNR